MRLAFLAALLGLLAAIEAAIAGSVLGTEFPFTGYVCTEQAEVAGGAGRRFYVTDHLPLGAEVEVYREDDAGWLAIRPPAGSFSWIPAEHVERLDGDVGKVKSPTDAWIGTSVEQVKAHTSQVALKAGELVQILAEKNVGEGGTQEKWLKIAPPAGEFRFIHSRDVSREPVAARPKPVDSGQEIVEEEPAEAGAEQAEQQEQAAQPRRFRPSAGAIALRDIDEVRSRLAAMREDLAGLAAGPQRNESVQLAQYKSSTGSMTDRSLSPDGFVPRKRRASEPLGPLPVPNNRFTHGHPSPTAARPKLDPLPRIADARAGELRSYPISAQPASSAASPLDVLELELSLMLAQDRAAWNLAALREKVQQVVDSGPDPAERGRARLLLDKIEQFEQAFAATEPSGRAPLDGAGQPASGTLADPHYDAQGWLKPVISKSKPIAPYAVVDADGKPLCFVTPSPGLNVGRYVNKQVGLYGRRGYIESLKAPHVTAERVIDLQRVVR